MLSLPIGAVRAGTGIAFSSAWSASSSRSAVASHCALEPLQQMRAPIAEIDDAWRKAVRMEAQPQHIDRRLQQVR